MEGERVDKREEELGKREMDEWGKGSCMAELKDERVRFEGEMDEWVSNGWRGEVKVEEKKVSRWMTEDK